MMKLTQQHVQHLLMRIGFGDQLDVVNAYQGQPAGEILKDQFKKTRSVRRIQVKSDLNPTAFKTMTKEEKQQMRMDQRSKLAELNSLWIKEMVQSRSGIGEKLAFFWHDHFACKSNRVDFMQSYLQTIRQHALGNFGDLLRAVSKTPAMLQYLNNQQNKKSAPNENFAREVMELFTLGLDNGYSEQDISEAARAFTGWGFTREGTFVERTRTHDFGQKSFFGNKGAFNGDDILDMLLENKQTANYISEKWVAYFVNYKGDARLQTQVANALYESNYDIKTGLTALFTSQVFFNKENIGSRIKSPIELIVGLQRQLQVAITDEQSLLFLQKTLGQTLFDPPNVAGWPDGKGWIDSASLMFRLRLPELVFKAAVIQNHPTRSFDDNDQFALRGKLKKITIDFDLEQLERSFAKDAIGEFLIQGNTERDQPELAFLDQIVYFTSKPEYQLC
ncbi:MAG: DUF1800 domain-containing protein [Bacteroidota bacterium]